MACQCWLLVLVTAYLSVPGFGSGCLESAICNNLSNKGRILDCVYLCMSAMQPGGPELRTLDSSVDDDADSDLLLSVILANVAPADSFDLQARNQERRAYAMEHFRWGKPSGDKVRAPKLRGHNNDRRSYSMEHFRWGKPPGRKRRPVKVFASSLEGGGSAEAVLPVQVRRQLRSGEDLAKDEADGGGLQSEEPLRSRLGSKSQVPLGFQQRKDGTYRMNHFRWGSPPASKRNGVFSKPWEEKPQGLAKIIMSIIVKDVQTIMG